MDAYKVEFLQKTAIAAEQAEHVWPDYAACEAGLESRFGTSALAIQDNNLFGMKQHSHPVYGTHVLPTKEFLDGEWTVVDANWIHYPSLRACFQDRMATLLRLASVYEHYAAALAAKDGVAFVTEVSKTWSTDPFRAQKVIAIYNVWKRGESSAQ